MTHRLRTSTRLVATGVSLTAAAAAADVVHTADGSGWSFLVAGLLTIAAVVVTQFHEVSLTIADDVVTVRNLLTSHELPRADVAAVVPGSWRSTITLADGSTVPVLLRADDLPDGVDVVREGRLIDLGALAAAA